MAKAYKCDICGRFFEEKPTTIAVISGGVVSRIRADRKNILVSDNACDFLVEICQDCRVSFVFWKDSRKPESYNGFRR